MHIKDSLINFLYDKKYFITLYDNSIYAFNYEKLITVKDDIIKIKIVNADLEITGENLRIKKMSKNEILVSGSVKYVGIDYE